MQPLPKISGRVLDPSGQPVPNATLTVIENNKGCNTLSCFSVLNKSKTGEKGEFSITDLEVLPGKWLLSATAPASFHFSEARDDQRLSLAQTFYPAATDPQLAAKILAQPGTELSNLEIKLVAVPINRIRGRIFDVGGDPVANAHVTLGNAFGPRLHQDTDSDGAFEFRSVADAEWRLSAGVDQDGVKLWAAQTLLVNRHDWKISSCSFLSRLGYRARSQGRFSKIFPLLTCPICRISF